MAKGPRQARTDRELRALSRHLLYEVDMLVATTAYLGALFDMKPDERPTAMVNAMLESWALHVRNLLVFLYEDRPGSDAAIAADFAEDWPS